jgi:hypothetical protein
VTRRPYDERSRLRDLALLGLEPGANEQEVKSAYRELVKAWHPDQFQPDDPQHARAENELKRINAAYTRIKRRPPTALGATPGARPARRTASAKGPGPSRPRRPAGGTAPPGASEDATPGWPPDDGEPSRARVTRQYVRAALLLAVAALCVWLNAGSPFGAEEPQPSPAGLGSALPSAGQTPVERYPEPAPSEPSENWHPLAREGMFAAGSTRSEVLAVQGRPDAIMGDEWWYGSSMVLFDAGRVSGYAIKSRPLRIGFDTREATATVFGVGSTKDEVLAIQGAPTFMEPRTWSYGMSRVEFDIEDRVSAYRVFDEPLKTRD